MKKLSVMMTIIFAMVILGSVCGADDKKGYVVRSVIDIPENYGAKGSTGEAYCSGNDYVTGCSYLLSSYPGDTIPADYTFPVVQPIQCSDDKEGFRVCTGCRVVLESTANLAPEVSFWVYAYCGRTLKH